MKMAIFAVNLCPYTSSLMEFRTLVSVPADFPSIGYADSLLLLGSCFADGMGERFARCGFRTECNPFGTLYNPHSVAAALDRLLSGRPFTADELTLFPAEGWGTWMHHSTFSQATQPEALAAINDRLLPAVEALRSATVLMITFGSAWVYALNEGDSNVVANCHRQPDCLFHRFRLSVDEVVQTWLPLIERLREANPSLRIVFTVSPIRYLRDGAHASQLSKATLLLAVETLCAQGNAAYFPAYEIVLDELRDYRFYADDMVHPSRQAADYLWERLGAAAFSPSTQDVMKRRYDVQRALAHRPFRPQSDEYRQFIRQTLSKAEALQKEIPNCSLEKEIAQCHILLNNSHP